MSNKKLTVGRIVLYRVADTDPPALRNNNAHTLPGIVVRVWSDDMANLKIMTDGNEDSWRTSVARGDGQGQWQWPGRDDDKAREGHDEEQKAAPVKP